MFFLFVFACFYVVFVFANMKLDKSIQIHRNICKFCIFFKIFITIY